MSSTVTIGTATETIHGTSAAAIDYVTLMYGETYTAWLALSANDQLKTLAAAVRYLNAQVWQSAYDTFAERDAVAAFETAEYELAVLIASDSSVLANADQGSNIQSVGAGGASVSYFNPTTKNAPKLPPVAMRLVGQYLASSSGAVSGSYVSGSDTNPFSDCEDYDRGEPY